MLFPMLMNLVTNVFSVVSNLGNLGSTWSSERCDHPNKDTGYPPNEFHAVLNSTFMSKYPEVMVIGDVHGCLDELQMLLEKYNATGDNVLKLLAGDISRKGPKSVDVIRYVRDTPSILAVRGNNDEKVLMRHYKHQHYNYRLKPADDFIKNMTHDDFHFMEHLPYTISVPDLNAIIVHAGLRPGIPLDQNQPYDMMNMRNLVASSHCEGGFRPHNGMDKGVRWAPQWKGPEHIYFGHDHPRNLQLTRYATGLDTSCVYGRHLTGLFIKGPRRGKLVTQRALQQYFSH